MTSPKVNIRAYEILTPETPVRISLLGKRIEESDGVPGVIQSISIEGTEHNLYVRYRVRYWEGRTLKEEWFNERQIINCSEGFENICKLGFQ